MAGRPPYTKEQIEALTTDAEKKRAIAEIQSMEIEGIREKTIDNASATGYIARLARERGEPTSEAHRSHGNSYSGAASNYQRHHPYQHQGPRFKNRSLTFNKPTNPSKSSALSNPGTHTTSKGSIGAPSKQSELTAATTTVPPGTAEVRTKQQRVEPRRPCPTFTRTGVCSRQTCYNAHDLQKLAICKVWLFKGECAKGAYCPLSHTSSPHNAPTCMHFQNGRCNNEECRFAHIRINPAAPNCEAFGLVGYCEKGLECAELHAHECPHFSNTGTCRFGDNCRLGHIRRASRMKNQSGRNSEECASPSAGHDEVHSDTASRKGNDDGTDSDAARIPHDFTQQVDFVSLLPDE